MTGYVEIGSVAWEHKQWLDKYYPEDLPADWLFSYFSKQFKTVCLPAAWLAAQSSDDVESWLEDCDAGFEFLLELPEELTGESFEEWQQKASLLEAQTLGYLFTVPSSNSDSISMHNLKIQISELTDKLPINSDRNLFLLPAAGCDLTLKELTQQETVQLIVSKDTVAESSDAQVAVLDFASQSDTRALGQFLNAFVNQNTEHACLYCYFRGDPPSYLLMQTAQSIVSLLDT